MTKEAFWDWFWRVAFMAAIVWLLSHFMTGCAIVRECVTGSLGCQ
jgi:hypothetical protein